MLLNFSDQTKTGLGPWRKHTEDSRGVKKEASFTWIKTKQQKLPTKWIYMLSFKVGMSQLRKEETFEDWILNPETFLFILVFILC